MVKDAALRAATTLSDLHPISPFVRFRARRRPLFVSGGMAKPEGWRRRFHGGRGDLSSVAHSAKEESLKADREIDGSNRRKAIRHADGFVVARSAISSTKNLEIPNFYMFYMVKCFGSSNSQTFKLSNYCMSCRMRSAMRSRQARMATGSSVKLVIDSITSSGTSSAARAATDQASALSAWAARRRSSSFAML